MDDLLDPDLPPWLIQLGLADLARIRAAVDEAIYRSHSFAMTTLEPWSDVWLSAVRLEDDYELAVQRVAGTVGAVRRALIDDLHRLGASLRR